MDLLMNDKRTEKFVTNVGLITSSGPYGPNIMAAEWTHHISYAPSLMMVCIGANDATYANIKERREFGISLAAVDQSSLVSIAGNNSGKKVDKIKILQEIGVKFYQAGTIDALMVSGATLNVECKLKEYIELGDHPLFIGEVTALSAIEQQPLIYHMGKYWQIGEKIQKPDEVVLARFASVIEKHKKKDINNL